MAKFIGVKMIEATPIRTSMALSAGYKIGNAHPDDIGYEVTYPDGYKSWSPAKEFEKAYYKPENFDLNVGANYAQIKAEDKIWEGFGFVLQWAKYGLKR